MTFFNIPISNVADFVFVLDAITHPQTVSEYHKLTSGLRPLYPADQMDDNLLRQIIGTELVNARELSARAKNDDRIRVKISVNMFKGAFFEAAFNFVSNFQSEEGSTATRETLMTALINALEETSVAALIAEADIPDETGKIKTVADPRHNTCLDAIKTLRDVIDCVGIQTPCGEKAIDAILKISSTAMDIRTSDLFSASLIETVHGSGMNTLRGLAESSFDNLALIAQRCAEHQRNRTDSLEGRPSFALGMGMHLYGIENRILREAKTEPQKLSSTFGSEAIKKAYHDNLDYILGESNSGVHLWGVVRSVVGRIVMCPTLTEASSALDSLFVDLFGVLDTPPIVKLDAIKSFEQVLDSQSNGIAEGMHGGIERAKAIINTRIARAKANLNSGTGPSGQTLTGK